MLDMNLGSNYFMESAITTQRGGTQQYDQWTFVLGYRFNNRSSARRLANAGNQ
jgi:hypothetical protein